MSMVIVVFKQYPSYCIKMKINGPESEKSSSVKSNPDQNFIQHTCFFKIFPECSNRLNLKMKMNSETRITGCPCQAQVTYLQIFMKDLSSFFLLPGLKPFSLLHALLTKIPPSFLPYWVTITWFLNLKTLFSFQLLNSCVIGKTTRHQRPYPGKKDILVVFKSHKNSRSPLQLVELLISY